MATFTNQASAVYNGGSAVSNIITGEVTQVLLAWKNATYGVYSTGDILTYVISIQNSGPNPMTDLMITDSLGAYDFGAGAVFPLTYTGDPVLYYINGVLQSTPAVTAGPPLVISDISVLPGTSSTIIYRVYVNNYAPLGIGAEIQNTATIIGTELANSIIVTETVTADQSASLSILKSLNPTTIVENGQITYTFTLQNTGPTAINASDDLVIRDTFLPILDTPLSVTYNGAPWAQSGNYTYNSATGEFATLPGSVTVPAATYVQDSVTGVWTVTPGVTTMTVTSTI